MTGGSARVWWLRICDHDRVDVEFLAEIKGGVVERQAAGFSPEIQRVTPPLTAKALKEVSPHVDGEAAIAWL